MLTNYLTRTILTTLGFTLFTAYSALAADPLSYPEVLTLKCEQAITNGLLIEFGPEHPEFKIEAIGYELLTENEFNQLLLNTYIEYEECQNHIFKTKLTMTESGESFIALISDDHKCDGGNTFGSLLNNEETHILAEIFDGFIECFPKAITIKPIHKAVCDTDYNCEVLYDRYKDYGITGVYVADDKLQNSENSVIKVQCKDGSTKFTSRHESLATICKYSPKETLNYLIKEAKSNKGKITSDFLLSAQELRYIIEQGYNKYARKNDNVPSLAEFLTFLLKHPEAYAGGNFTMRENDKTLILDYIQLEFIPTSISIDYFKFCSTADEITTDNNVTRCWWD